MHKLTNIWKARITLEAVIIFFTLNCYNTLAPAWESHVSVWTSKTHFCFMSLLQEHSSHWCLCTSERTLVTSAASQQPCAETTAS